MKTTKRANHIMPYISSEEMTAVKKALKAAVGKEVKLSIRKRHHSTVVVSIMKSKIDFKFRDQYSQKYRHEGINHFHYENNHKDQPEVVKLVKTILDTIYGTVKCGGYESGDYGFVPDYYVDINFGASDKPYEVLS